MSEAKRTENPAPPSLVEAAQIALHMLADQQTPQQIADNFNGYNVIDGLRAALAAERKRLSERPGYRMEGACQGL